MLRASGHRAGGWAAPGCLQELPAAPCPGWHTAAVGTMALHPAASRGARDISLLPPLSDTEGADSLAHELMQQHRTSSAHMLESLLISNHDFILNA